MPGKHGGGGTQNDVIRVDPDAVPGLRSAFTDALDRVDRQLELAEAELRVTSWAKDPVSQGATVLFNDVTPPVLTAPPDVTVTCQAVPPPVSPPATDTCDPAPAVTFQDTRADGSCADRYTLTRTWTAHDACGNTTSAVFSELMCTTAAAAKLGGIVVDGAIRDVDGIRKLGFPAYSRTVCAGGWPTRFPRLICRQR